MIEVMSTFHMNENEVTANFADVLEKIRHGVEVIVERNHQPIAVIRSPHRSGRLISECFDRLRSEGNLTLLGTLPATAYLADLGSAVEEPAVQPRA